jgi:tRNA pseudouridine38-40 synthase
LENNNVPALREQRYRATVEYDGTEFLGYQIQAAGRTVQDEIERSLKQVTQTFVRIDAAGRTDTGVHAIGQVIAFNAAWRHTTEDLHRALNATLPHDIIISSLTTADREFHPRFDALSRTYRYQIVNQRWPGVLSRRYAYHVKAPLNVAAMNEAAKTLLGRHDFASFGKPPQGNNSVRDLLQAEWLAAPDKSLHFYVTANAFLYRMVRKIVGTLVQVGVGQLDVADVEAILAAKNLKLSAPPAPAHGLCLVQVTYPNIA